MLVTFFYVVFGALSGFAAWYLAVGLNSYLGAHNRAPTGFDYLLILSFPVLIIIGAKVAYSISKNAVDPMLDLLKIGPALFILIGGIVGIGCIIHILLF